MESQVRRASLIPDLTPAEQMIHALDCLTKMTAERDALRERLAAIEKIVAEQAKNKYLWEADTSQERLQDALLRLRHAIEGKT